MQELEAALIKADAAGNTADAKVFADEIRRLRAAGQPPEGNAVGDFVQGIGGGFGRVATAAAELVPRGLDAIGLERAAEWARNDIAPSRQNLDAGMARLKARSPMATGAGELVGEIAATYPVGGVLGGAVRGLGAATGAGRAVAPLADALSSAGLRSGGVGGVGGLALKSAGGAATGGAATALVDPQAAGQGALLGGMLPGVWQGTSRVMGAAGKAFRPDVAAQPLAQRAVELGAPLGVADLSNNGMVRGARSILNDSIFAGGVGAKQEAAKQAWFNKAVGRTFGAEAESLTPEVMDAAKKRLGDEFDRIWGNNNIRVDDELLGSLSKLRNEANLLPEGEQRRLLSHLDDIESRVVPGADGSMMIPGEVANRFQSSLRRTVDGAQGFLKNNLNELRQSVVGAFNRSVSPQDAAALKLTQGQYKAMKTVEPLLQKAEASVAGRTPGDIPPALLSQAVVNSYKGGVANSPLTEVAQIGQRFLVDRVPRTGGSPRALLQNAAIGGALGTGAWMNPYTLLAVPAAMGINRALGSPAVARGLMAAPQAGGLLSGGGISGGLLDLAVRAAPLLSSSQ